MATPTTSVSHARRPRRNSVLITATPDMAAVVDTLTRAFDPDPILNWAFPPAAANREQSMAAFFRITTELLLEHGGQVGVAPEYAAVAVWSPPGEPALSELEQTRYFQRLADACGECGERAVALMRALDDQHPPGLPAHYHVMFAAARPEPAAVGRAVLLIRALLKLEELRGCGLYAEASSPQNRDLWLEMGLRRVGDEIVLPAGGPSLYPVWRAPDPPTA
ncbi:GNAT family N-acetyltransferase [Frankia sp. AgPm24]|uniref:GNAT family N-acetyltransferase n=1 Tax=Frankia sp. AgPm24 TaxID=631128 RepID=UPI0020105806|nr:GNAT family N-acetyltransferase [Frankia sp. AgPm24]MCK9924230.1 GNAT family N-acetyltransferase [Frankia sp. AgPm24]